MVDIIIIGILKKILFLIIKSIQKSKVENVEIGFHFFEKNDSVGITGKISKEFTNRYKSLQKNAFFCVMVNASDVLKVKNISRFKSLVIDFKNSKLSLIRIACYFKELDKVK